LILLLIHLENFEIVKKLLVENKETRLFSLKKPCG